MAEFDVGFGDAAMGIDPSGFNLGVNTSFQAPEFNIPAGIDVAGAAPAGPGFDANAMLSGAEKAAGVTRMPPAYAGPLPTATSQARVASASPSTVTRNRWGLYTASVRSTAAT